MSPHALQQKVHSSFSSQSSDWAAIRLEIETVLENLPNKHIFDGHLLREFNKKVYSLGFDGLAFVPHDGGYRYIRGSEELIASNIVLDSDNESVFDSNFNQVLS